MKSRAREWIHFDSVGVALGCRLATLIIIRPKKEPGKDFSGPIHGLRENHDSLITIASPALSLSSEITFEWAFGALARILQILENCQKAC